MVRYFLTDLRGNPIYSFAQRLRLRGGGGGGNNNNIGNVNGNNLQHHHPQMLVRSTNRFRNTNNNDEEEDDTNHGDHVPYEDHEDHVEDIDNNTMIDYHRTGTATIKDGRIHRDHIRTTATTSPVLLLHTVTNFSSICLVCMIRNRIWDDVYKRIQTHTNEIYSIDSITGNTILHSIYKYNPPCHIITLLCEYYQYNLSILRYPNIDGITPLHIAVTHRCSKQALQTLFDSCRLSYTYNGDNNVNGDGTVDTEHHHKCTNNNHKKHISPTADLSRIGRAPIHYACMSFRGLDIDAFQLLFNETIQHGNVWVYDTTTSTSSKMGNDEYDDEYDDDYDFDNYFDVPGNSTSSYVNMMDVVNEHDDMMDDEDQYEGEGKDDECGKNHTTDDPINVESRDDIVLLCEFDQEVDRHLYQTYNNYNKTSSTPDKLADDELTTGYGCPPELIRLAISIHPNQVMEMDDDGNLPIHIAVTAASYLAYTNPISSSSTTSTNTNSNFTRPMTSYFHSSNNSVGGGGGGGDDHSSVISDAAMSFFSSATVSQSTNPFDQVIKILLQHYPDGARTPHGKNGRLPLVLALESKIGQRTWNDGIRTLLHAYPPALHNKKIIEPILYPHVLSLVANNGTPPSSTTNTNNSTDKNCSFDFSGYVDILPNNSRHGTSNNSRTMNVQTKNQANYNSSSIHHHHRSTTKQRRSQRTIRQELCCRTTLYELLRSKPEWLTLGYV